MTALLTLPSPDELQLTAEELARITGARTKALQIDWLDNNGWHYTKTRAGEPVVGRLYANLKMAGLDVATMVIPEAWEPDFGAISK